MLLKRTALRSKSALARRTPIRAKRWGIAPKPARRIRREGAAGRSFLDWVKTQLCCARFISPCAGPIDPHHAGRRPGTGMKAADRTAIPLCRRHHGQVETLAGLPFRLWTKAFRRAWADEQIAHTQALFARAHAEAGLPAPGVAA